MVSGALFLSAHSPKYDLVSPAVAAFGRPDQAHICDAVGLLLLLLLFTVKIRPNIPTRRTRVPPLFHTDPTRVKS